MTQMKVKPMEVKCSKCGYVFYTRKYKMVSCPKCGTVIEGPKS